MDIDLEAHEPTRRNWLSFSAMAGVTGLNAFNDNFARFMLLPLAGWLVAQGQGFAIEHWLGLLLVAPYIFFAPSSGWLADRFSKNKVVRWAAWMQLLVLGVDVFFYLAAFALDGGGGFLFVGFAIGAAVAHQVGDFEGAVRSQEVGFRKRVDRGGDHSFDFDWANFGGDSF